MRLPRDRRAAADLLTRSLGVSGADARRATDSRRSWVVLPGRFSADQRRKLGVEVDLIGPDRLADLEPNLRPGLGGAAFFTGATFLDDPGRMMGLIAGAASASSRSASSG